MANESLTVCLTVTEDRNHRAAGINFRAKMLTCSFLGSTSFYPPNPFYIGR